MPQAILPGAYYGKFLQQLQQTTLVQANRAAGGGGIGPTSTLTDIASAAASSDPTKRPQVNGSLLATIDAQLSQTIAGIDTSLAGVGISANPGEGKPVSPIATGMPTGAGLPGVDSALLNAPLGAGLLNSFTGGLPPTLAGGGEQAIINMIMPILERLKPIVERMQPAPKLEPVKPIEIPKPILLAPEPAPLQPRDIPKPILLAPEPAPLQPRDIPKPILLAPIPEPTPIAGGVFNPKPVPKPIADGFFNQGPVLKRTPGQITVTDGVPQNSRSFEQVGRIFSALS